jgi:hypothetical protein
MVVDNTGADAQFWWATDASSPAGPFDERLFEVAGPTWISPSDTMPAEAFSSIFRRADITLNNALSLARLYGAGHVVIGDVAREGANEQPWLGLPRSEIVFRGVVVDVRSGSVVHELEIRRVSYSAEGSAQASRAVADQVRRAAEALVHSPGDVGVADEAEVVVVRSHESAAPFIAVRGALRDVHPGVVDVGEAWATEGQIALRLVLDEGVAFDDVARSIERLAGLTVGDTVVGQVRTTDRGIEIEALPVAPELEAP